MIYKIDEKALRVLMSLFGSEAKNMGDCPGFTQYKLSRGCIRNYSLHPLMRLRVATNLAMDCGEYYLTCKKDQLRAGTHTFFHIGNFSDVESQFQHHPDAPQKVGDINQAQVVVVLSHDHSTRSHANTTATHKIGPLTAQTYEGLNNHWVNRYVWVLPGKPDNRKVVSRLYRYRHGDKRFIGDDTVRVKYSTGFYFVRGYSPNIDKIA